MLMPCNSIQLADIKLMPEEFILKIYEDNNKCK